jgi:hypothetical protein
MKRKPTLLTASHSAKYPLPNVSDDDLLSAGVQGMSTFILGKLRLRVIVTLNTTSTPLLDVPVLSCFCLTRISLDLSRKATMAKPLPSTVGPIRLKRIGTWALSSGKNTCPSRDQLCSCQ